jgi:oligopeptide/dipeptide ABC transporter ATP-binding protein
VELADSGDLYSDASHPYTQALLSAIPVADLDHRSNRIILEGDVPNPVNPPSGCPFHPRCRRAMAVCCAEAPRLEEYDVHGKKHFVSCHLMKLRTGATQGVVV